MIKSHAAFFICLAVLVVSCSERTEDKREQSRRYGRRQLEVKKEMSKNRQKALEVLWNAYTKLQQGDQGAIHEVEQASKIDPNLAYANIVRAEYAMKNQHWELAETYFQKGLKHLHEPNQPLSPSNSIVITAKEVEASARVFLGYTYVQLAKKANIQGATQLEKKCADSAKMNLQKGLKLKPEPEIRQMAERLLKMFRY